MIIKITELSEELKNENTYFLKDFKNNKQKILNNKRIALLLGFDELNLNQKLYGNSKKESSKIQKCNTKILLRLFSKIKKSIKFLIKNNIDFNSEIYIENLSSKKNNNDILLAGFLDIEFDDVGNKYEKIIDYL